jgi:hypothetical protein
MRRNRESEMNKYQIYKICGKFIDWLGIVNLSAALGVYCLTKKDPSAFYICGIMCICTSFILNAIYNASIKPAAPQGQEDGE